MNKDEAVNCCNLGACALQEGDYLKAIRLLERALRSTFNAVPTTCRGEGGGGVTGFRTAVRSMDTTQCSRRVSHSCFARSVTEGRNNECSPIRSKLPGRLCRLAWLKFTPV